MYVILWYPPIIIIHVEVIAGITIKNCNFCRNMTGLEYILLHVQDPILYVIRKQHRHSPTQATPLADYYIIAGIVYQAPDLASVLNSRLVSIITDQC